MEGINGREVMEQMEQREQMENTVCLSHHRIYFQFLWLSSEIFLNMKWQKMKNGVPFPFFMFLKHVVPVLSLFSVYFIFLMYSCFVFLEGAVHATTQTILEVLQMHFYESFCIVT